MTRAPDTEAIAAALGVEPDRLRSFVDHHPDPEPSYIFGWAEADPGHKAEVAAWLDEYLREARRERQARRERLASMGEEA